MNLVDLLKRAIDASIEFEKLPTEYRRTRDGWAGYKGSTRITKFCFSENGAREAVVARENARVPITVVDE